MKDKAEKFINEEYYNLILDCSISIHGEIFNAMQQFAMQQLEEYTNFLLKEGYCDTDVYCEPPTAIDRFIHPKLR